MKLYEEVIEEEYLHKMRDVIEKKKKVQLDKINKIKVDLRALLEEN